MTNPADFRALCAELVKALEEKWDSPRPNRLLMDRAHAALAAPQQGAPSDHLAELVTALRGPYRWTTFNDDQLDTAADLLESYGAQAVPVAVADVRYEFAVYDAETDEPQAGGSAPTLEEAQREGQHYFAMYSEDGPMRLELRRVEVLPLPEAQP